jgi:hypothetical protein
MARDEQTKAKASSLLLLGYTAYHVARTLNLPEQTVRNWYNDLLPQKMVEIGGNRASRIADLLHDYLSSNLSSLRVQVELAGDLNYLKKFPPTQLAQIHEIMADKAARMLEVGSGITERESSDGEGEETEGEPEEKATIVKEHYDDNTSTSFTRGTEED